MLKWVMLALLIAAVGPATQWLRAHPNKLTAACFLLGFLPFVTNWCHLLTVPIAWPQWVGYTKGLELYVVDFVALVILLFMKGRLIRPRFTIFMALYFLTTGIAVFASEVPVAAIFYCWQLLRVFLMYFVVANVCALEFGAVGAILTGLAFGEFVECAVALWERIGLHVLQTPGTMDSQNELGIATHFVVLPFFAILLGGRRGWLPLAAVLAGLLTDALTTSRGAAALVLLGLALVWAFSSFAQFSSRKLKVAALGLVAIALMSPLAIASFQARFAHSGTIGLAEDVERLAFKRATSMMIADHPMGVGPNNFALVANTGGYYARAGSGLSYGSRSTNVHNIYLMIWAEAGPWSMVSYLLLFVAVLWASVRFAAARGRWISNDPSRDILVGASVTVLIICVHSTEEWVMVVSVLQYLLAILFGLISGLTADLSNPSKSRKLFADPRSNQQNFVALGGVRRIEA